MAAFTSMCAGEDGPLSVESSIAFGILAPFFDSCMSQCGGTDDSLDTAKTIIATALVPRADKVKELEALKGTSLKLSYFSHKKTDNGALIKAHISISMDDMTVYEGFTFLKLENLEGYQPQNKQENIILYLLGLMSGKDFYITDSNTPELYTAFGDSADGLEFSSDLKSLYDFWDYTTKQTNGYSISHVVFNDASAFMAGYSAEKIEGFKEYTVRYNLTYLRQQRVEYQYQLQLCQTTESIGRVAIFTIDLCTSPVTTVIDALAEQNKTADVIWTGTKLIFNPYDTIKDEVLDLFTDTIFDELSSESEKLRFVIAIYDKMIENYSLELKKLAAR